METGFLIASDGMSQASSAVMEKSYRTPHTEIRTLPVPLERHVRRDFVTEHRTRPLGRGEW